MNNKSALIIKCQANQFSVQLESHPRPNQPHCLDKICFQVYTLINAILERTGRLYDYLKLPKIGQLSDSHSIFKRMKLSRHTVTLWFRQLMFSSGEKRFYQIMFGTGGGGINRHAYSSAWTQDATCKTSKWVCIQFKHLIWTVAYYYNKAYMITPWGQKVLMYTHICLCTYICHFNMDKH